MRKLVASLLFLTLLSPSVRAEPLDDQMQELLRQPVDYQKPLEPPRDDDWSTLVGTPWYKPVDHQREAVLEILRRRPELCCDMTFGLLPERAEVYLEFLERYPENQRLLYQLDQLSKKRSEFLAAASHPVAVENYIQGESELFELARTDWTRAEPILDRLDKDPDLRLRTLALSVRYDREPSEQLCQELIRIALNESAPNRARAHALCRVLAKPWPGRKAFYLSLFRTQSLREIHDGNEVWYPLAFSPYGTRADFPLTESIPEVVAYLASSDRDEREAAIIAFLEMDDPPREAVIAMLPWLSDSDWSASREGWKLTRLVGRYRITEAIPDLKRLAEKGDFEAAASLEAMGQTPPASALATSTEWDVNADEKFEIRLRHATPEEIVVGLMALAEKVAATEDMSVEPYGRYRIHGIEQPQPDPLGLGTYADGFLDLARDQPQGCPVDRRVVDLALQQLPELRRSRPRVAQALERLAERWAFIEDYACGEILAGRGSWHLALRLVAKPPAELDAGRAHGAALGILTAAARDSRLQREVLTGKDPGAKIALLACARYSQLSLPEDVTPALLSDPSTRPAAEAYLAAVDGEQALSAGGSRIIRGRLGPDGSTDWEKPLQAEFDADPGLTDIYALLGDPPTVVRVWADHHQTVRLDNPSSWQERDLSPADLSLFLRTLGAADELPTWGSFTQHFQGLTGYLHLTPQGGRRVQWVIGNAKLPHPRYQKIQEAFAGLDVSEQPVRYRAQGSKVLYQAKDEDHEAISLAREGDKLLVMVGSRYYPPKNRPAWFELTASGLVAWQGEPPVRKGWDPSPFGGNKKVTEVPTRWGRLTFERQRGFTHVGSVNWQLQDRFYFEPALDEQTGSILVSVASPNGETTSVRLIEIETGKMRPLEIPEANWVFPSYNRVLKKFVVSRRGNDPEIATFRARVGPVKPEYYGVDPASGATERLPESYMAEGYDPELQPAGSDQVWMVRDAHEVGVYYQKTLRFEPRYRFPEVSLEAATLWVGADEIVAVQAGNVIQLPAGVGSR